MKYHTNVIQRLKKERRKRALKQAQNILFDFIAVALGLSVFMVFGALFVLVMG